MHTIQPEPFATLQDWTLKHKSISLYDFLCGQLDELLDSDDANYGARKHAKTVTGFLAKAAHLLYQMSDPPFKSGKYPHLDGWFPFLKALQPYQMRQLVETALFWDDKTPNAMGSRRYRDHRIEVFLEWARNNPSWTFTHDKVTARREAFIQDAERMGLNDHWGKKLKKKRPELAENNQEALIPQVKGMLMPALDMTSALDKVGTPVQKVLISY